MYSNSSEELRLPSPFTSMTPKMRRARALGDSDSVAAPEGCAPELEAATVLEPDCTALEPAVVPEGTLNPGMSLSEDFGASFHLSTMSHNPSTPSTHTPSPAVLLCVGGLEGGGWLRRWAFSGGGGYGG